MGEGGRRGAKQREKGRARALVHHSFFFRFDIGPTLVSEENILGKHTIRRSSCREYQLRDFSTSRSEGKFQVFKTEKEDELEQF